MLVTCKYCGEEFLTEADQYVVTPIDNYEVGCGCNFYRIQQKDEQIKILLDAVEFYSDSKNWIPKYSSDRYPAQIMSKDNYYYDGHFKIGGKKAREALEKYNNLHKN